METYMLTQYLLAENSCLSQVDSEVMKRKHGHGKRGAGGQQLRVDLSACKYELFRIVAERLGWQIVPLGSTDWDLYWTDTSICQQRLLKLSPTQRINHFHGMLELCRKRAMARSLSALAAAAAPLGISYDFCPYTWQLPGQMTAFLAAAKAAGKKATFIVKPDAGCQGKGIKLVKGGSEDKLLKSLADIAATQAVAQQYVAKPLLVNGLKFDLRVYVLVADVDPLRVYIFKEGLVRFCTAPYKKPTSTNIDCAYMHLTNYAVNKHNTEAYVAAHASGYGSTQAVGAAGQECNVEAASKWTFKQLKHHLDSQGHSWSALWGSIGELIVKSLIAVAPHLAATYRSTVVNNISAASQPSAVDSSSTGSGTKCASAATVAAAGCRCFEVLGYDVLLDDQLKPWLLEVNHSPSFNIDSPLDRTVKEQLIMDAVKLVRIEPRAIAAAKKASRRATQQRLLAPTSARGCSSSSTDVSVSVATADSRTAQQAFRDAVIAARDKWQMKHLGKFERLYPVSLPTQQQASSYSSSSSSHHTPPADCIANYSEAKLTELLQLQDTYDRLLVASQQVYLQQRQQQSPAISPARIASSPARTAGQKQQLPKQSPLSGLRSNSNVRGASSSMPGQCMSSNGSIRGSDALCDANKPSSQAPASTGTDSSIDQGNSNDTDNTASSMPPSAAPGGVYAVKPLLPMAQGQMQAGADTSAVDQSYEAAMLPELQQRQQQDDDEEEDDVIGAALAVLAAAVSSAPALQRPHSAGGVRRINKSSSSCGSSSAVVIAPGQRLSCASAGRQRRGSTGMCEPSSAFDAIRAMSHCASRNGSSNAVCSSSILRPSTAPGHNHSHPARSASEPRAKQQLPTKSSSDWSSRLGGQAAHSTGVSHMFIRHTTSGGTNRSNHSWGSRSGNSNVRLASSKKATAGRSITAAAVGGATAALDATVGAAVSDSTLPKYTGSPSRSACDPSAQQLQKCHTASLLGSQYRASTTADALSVIGGVAGSSSSIDACRVMCEGLLCSVRPLPLAAGPCTISSSTGSSSSHSSSMPTPATWSRFPDMKKQLQGGCGLQAAGAGSIGTASQSSPESSSSMCQGRLLLRSTTIGRLLGRLQLQ